MLCESVVVVAGDTATIDTGVDADVDTVDDAEAIDIVAAVDAAARGAIACAVVTDCAAVVIRGLFTKTIAFGPVVLSVVVTVPWPSVSSC